MKLEHCDFLLLVVLTRNHVLSLKGGSSLQHFPIRRFGTFGTFVCFGNAHFGCIFVFVLGTF